MSPFFGVQLFVLTTSGVTLEVDSPKRQVLVGEPIKLVLRWGGPRATDLPIGDQQSPVRYLEFWINDGVAQKRYCDTDPHPGAGLSVHAIPKGTEVYVHNIALARGTNGADCRGDGEKFVFEKAGDQALDVRYRHGAHVTMSNRVVFMVREPQMEDAAMLDRVRRDPDILFSGASRGEDLVKKHPGSPYLQLARIRRLDEGEIRLRGRRSPETGESLRHLSNSEFTAYSTRYYARLARELRQETEWTSFDEERLQLGITYAERGGQHAVAEELGRELLERFPASQAARALGQRR
jgi:hypothetical protein